MEFIEKNKDNEVIDSHYSQRRGSITEIYSFLEDFD